MTIAMMERKFEYYGYWVIKNKKTGLYQLQQIEGNILEEKYNLEGLENKLERLERN